MEAEPPLESLKWSGNDIQTAVSKVLIFSARSNRLAEKLVAIIESISIISKTPQFSDPNSKNNISLFIVTVDDILEYFGLISTTSLPLLRHLQKYGSDEECFYKWNERLRLISVYLNLTEITKKFDTKQDRLDYRVDIKHLRENFDIITADKEAVTSICYNLDSQETNAYKTVQNVEAGIVIKAKMIKYDKVLGKGGFGEVWRARIKSDFVAVKKIPINLLTDEAKANLKAEAAVMRSLSHPGIVACIGVIDEPADFCLIMELCDGGSLENLIKTRKDLSLRIRVDLALDIANAMSYLHRLHIVHRDLKPGNIVMDDTMRPKITDFGLAFKQSATMTSFRGSETGTPAFMAPECFGLAPLFSTRSDVFAFAIVLWELLHMKPAYSEVSPIEIRESIREGTRLPISADISPELALLVTQAWDQNARSRPTFSEIGVFLKGFLATSALVRNDPVIRPLLSVIPLHTNPTHTKKADVIQSTPTMADPKYSRTSWSRLSMRKKLLVVASIFFIFTLVGGGILAAILVTASRSESSGGDSNFGSTILELESTSKNPDDDATMTTVNANPEQLPPSPDLVLSNLPPTASQSLIPTSTSSEMGVSDYVAITSDFTMTSLLESTVDPVLPVTTTSMLDSTTVPEDSSSQYPEIQTSAPISTFQELFSDTSVDSSSLVEQISTIFVLSTISSDDTAQTTIDPGTTTSEIILTTLEPTSTTSTIPTSAIPTRTSIPITPSSIINVTTMAQNGTTLRRVWGLTIDEEDNIYVATNPAATGNVFQVYPNGTLNVIYDFKNDGLGRFSNFDQGICYFNGSLYLPRVSQITKIDLRNNNTVSRFSGTGVATNVTVINGSPDVSTFSSAVNCKADSVGNIYVSDYVDTSIRMVDQDGFTSTFFDNIYRPQSVEFDINGIMLIAAPNQNYILRRTSSTTVSFVRFGGYPNSVVTDLFGNLFYSDYISHSIYWIDTQNVVRNLTGLPNSAGFLDGNATTARFNSPRMLVFDSKGKLYLTDQFNSAIRVISWT